MPCVDNINAAVLCFINMLLQIEIPMMILNTEDDPIVPKELLDPAYKLACKSQVTVCYKGRLHLHSYVILFWSIKFSYLLIFSL